MQLQHSMWPPRPWTEGGRAGVGPAARLAAEVKGLALVVMGVPPPSCAVADASRCVPRSVQARPCCGLVRDQVAALLCSGNERQLGSGRGSERQVTFRGAADAKGVCGKQAPARPRMANRAR